MAGSEISIAGAYTVGAHQAYELEVESRSFAPDVDRWSQRNEWMLNGVNDFGLADRSIRYETQKYNGYGDYVAELYA